MTDLELCDNGHPCVAYSRKLNCPVCDAKRETEESDSELSKALARIDELKDEVATLRGELNSLKTP